MDFLKLLVILNYGLVLIYGLLLSTHIAGGWSTRQQKMLIFALCPLLLLIQIFCWTSWGLTTTMQIYPLITHLPLVLILIFALKKRVGTSLVSVLTAYLCCQLPRWVKLMLTTLTASPLVGEISYTVAIVPIYLLLRRYFVRIANDAMTCSPQTMFLFGSLPCVYYIFEYTMLIGTDILQTNTPAFTEFIPTALTVFYVAFLAAYHVQMQQRTQAELQKSILEVALRQSGIELESIRRAETQTAIYRHDLRHHLTAIDGFLSLGKSQQAQEYIRNVHADLMSITLKRFCENELVNLLCSAFWSRAEREGVQLTVDADLSEDLKISDMELCAILSNGLENAIHAVSHLGPSLKWIEFYSGIRLDNLLIEIKNPYEGEIYIRDGLPVSNHEGHGYGCQSILAIAKHHGGFCVFEAEHGVFIMRVVLPMNRSVHRSEKSSRSAKSSSPSA